MTPPKPPASAGGQRGEPSEQFPQRKNTKTSAAQTTTLVFCSRQIKTQTKTRNGASSTGSVPRRRKEERKNAIYLKERQALPIRSSVGVGRSCNAAPSEKRGRKRETRKNTLSGVQPVAFSGPEVPFRFPSALLSYHKGGRSAMQVIDLFWANIDLTAGKPGARRA